MPRVKEGAYVIRLKSIIMSDTHIHPHRFKVGKKDRMQLLKQQPKLLWFTGLSGSGKSTLANGTETRLHQLGFKTYLLDGDNIRSGLSQDLGFTDGDRIENMRRIGEVAKLMLDAGLVVVSAFISPFRKDREMISKMVGKQNFLEIYVNCPLEVCEKRDVKGLYKMAREGQIKNFTGIDSPYEAPEKPFLDISSVDLNIEAALDGIVEKVLREIKIEK